MKAIRNFCGRSDMGFVAIILLVAFAYLSFCYFNFHRERSRIQACEDPTLITTSVSGSWQRGTGSEDTRYIYRCADGSMIETTLDVNAVQRIKEEQGNERR